MLSAWSSGIVALCVLGQEGVPVSSLTVDHSRIPAKATYKAMVKPPYGKAVDLGTITMETKVDGNIVLLSDSASMKRGPDGPQGTGVVKAECEKDALLTLRKAEGTPPEFEETPKFSIVVSDDKSTMVVKMEGRDDREEKFPKDVVYGFAIFRIPSLLPQEEGKQFSVAGILDPEGKVEAAEETAFVCEGKATFEREGKEMEAIRYTVKGGDRRPPMDFYVDEKGALQRVIIAERQIMDLVEEDLTPSREDGK